MTVSLMALPASPDLVAHTGLSTDTSAGSFQPFSSGELASCLDGGDMFFRIVFDAKEDLALSIANATAGAHDMYIIRAFNGGGDVFSLRWDHVSTAWKVAINGVDRQEVYAIEGNTLGWSTLGAQTDRVVLDFAWCPSIGHVALRMHVGSVDNDGFDNVDNLAYGYPNTPSYLGGVVYAVGNVLVPSSGPNGLRSLVTTGATAGIGLTTPYVIDDGTTLSIANGQGSTFIDSNGLAVKAIATKIPVGAGLSAPTTCYVGSFDGASAFFPMIVREVHFMRRGYHDEPPSARGGGLGDSQMTSWLWRPSNFSRMRTNAEIAASAPFFLTCAFPGLRFQGAGFKDMYLSSKLSVFGRAGIIKFIFMQGGTNDAIGGRTGPQIVADAQDTVTNGVRVVDTTATLFICPAPYEKGALSAGQFTAWGIFATACFAQWSGNQPFSILSVSNTTPVQLQVSATASLTTNNYLYVPPGQTGIAAIDGKVWKYTVVDGTHVSLQTSTAAGAAGAGGYFMEGGATPVLDPLNKAHYPGSVVSMDDGQHGGTADALWTTISVDGEHVTAVGRDQYGVSVPASGFTWRSILNVFGWGTGG